MKNLLVRRDVYNIYKSANSLPCKNLTISCCDQSKLCLADSKKLILDASISVLADISMLYSYTQNNRLSIIFLWLVESTLVLK